MQSRVSPYYRSPSRSEPPLFAARRPIRPQRVHRAVRCAAQGLTDAWRSEPNFRLHVYCGAGLIALGVWMQLAVREWLWVLAAVGLLIFAELVNTTVEYLVDLIVGLRPDPLARRIKDLAAGFVLVTACLAVTIESLVFIPHFMRG